MKSKSTLFTILSATLLTVSINASAASSNPFATIQNGFTLVAQTDAAGKCGTAKCGADKKTETKCGAAKPAPTDTKCGAAKPADSKCGAAKCGASK